MQPSIYDFTVQDINKNSINLDSYKGKTLVIVNTASKCGFTNQYTGLEELYAKYKDQGLVILGFPCNQFLSQEPGDEEEIKNFCSLTYNVTFPMFAKVNVNGADAAPLYKFLKKRGPGIPFLKAIKWNFTKFLINKHGEVVARYAPTTKPAMMEQDIVKLLAKE